MLLKGNTKIRRWSFIERTDDGLTLAFKALGHPIRRKILDILKEGPKTTGYLDDAFSDISRYAVMKHLTVLEEAKLVLIRREGRTRLNYLNAVPLQQISDRWMTRYQSTLASSLGSLKSNIEKGINKMTEQTGFKHDSFQIEQEVEIQGSIESVFKSLTSDINSWWAFRLCGENSTLSIEPKVGGRFLEQANSSSGALWGVINYINAPVELRFNGLLGMKGAVNSSYTFKLEEKGNSTILKLSHHAAGLLDPNWEQAHDEGWKELLGKYLKAYVEEGKSYSEVK